MVVRSNTVVDPRAMVIKPLNTSVANAAVTGFLSSDHFTVWAQQHRIKFFKNFHKGNVSWLPKVTGIHAHSCNMQ